MDLLVKALAGATIVVIIQLLARTKSVYLAGLVPLFPTFALIAHYLVGMQRGAAALKQTIRFGMWSLIPYFVYLLVLYWMVDRFRLGISLFVAASCWLVVAALLDPDPELRRAAIIALLKRKSDPRIVGELRKALNSDDEWVLRNAADALGVLRATEAVPDLIDRLSVQIEIEHPVSQPSLFSGVAQTFIRGYRAKVARGVAQIEPIVEGAPIGVMLGYQDHPVVEYATIYRTEVQEALVEITGVNHGFDREAWLDWWARNNN